MLRRPPKPAKKEGVQTNIFIYSEQGTRTKTCQKLLVISFVKNIAVVVDNEEGAITSGAGFCTVYGKSATIPYSASTGDNSLSENEQ